MHADGIIKSYAIGGAVAATFYIEPTATYDIDIFVPFQQESGAVLVSLSGIFDYLMRRGYRPAGAHIVIEGWQVQFLPADDSLLGEALEQAVGQAVGETKTRVMTPEHLMAIALRTGRGKDLIRLTQFVENKAFDPVKLNQILERHNLRESWARFKSKYLDAET